MPPFVSDDALTLQEAHGICQEVRAPLMCRYFVFGRSTGADIVTDFNLGQGDKENSLLVAAQLSVAIQKTATPPAGSVAGVVAVACRRWCEADPVTGWLVSLRPACGSARRAELHQTVS